MDARSVLQENVQVTLAEIASSAECWNMDELARLENDLQVGGKDNCSESR